MTSPSSGNGSTPNSSGTPGAGGTPATPPRKGQNPPPPSGGAGASPRPGLTPPASSGFTGSAKSRFGAQRPGATPPASGTTPATSGSTPPSKGASPSTPTTPSSSPKGIPSAAPIPPWASSAKVAAGGIAGGVGKGSKAAPAKGKDGQAQDSTKKTDAAKESSKPTKKSNTGTASTTKPTKAGGLKDNNNLRSAVSKAREEGVGAATKDLARAAAKEAISRGVQAASGGVVPKVVLDKAQDILLNRRTAKVVGYSIAGVLTALFLVILLIITSIITLIPNPGAPDSDGAAYVANVQPYIADGWNGVLVNAIDEADTGDIPVPWTVLGGIAKVATDFARTSPYDEIPIDRDPNRTTKDSFSPSNQGTMSTGAVATDTNLLTPGVVSAGDLSSFEQACPVKNPDPAIGGKDGQGSGAFLVSPSLAATMREEGRDPQNACSSAIYVARALSETAEALDEDDNSGVKWNPDSEDETRKFWQQVITSSGAVVNAASATCAPTTIDPSMTVSSLINSIWGCEIDAVGGITVVSSMTKDASGKAVPGDVLTGYTARSQAISEALSAAQYASNLGAAACTASDRYAGVFPLTADQATSLNVADRCNQVSNIQAAAKLYIQTESKAPDTRSDKLGPYQVQVGGWASMLPLLGNEEARARLFATGPSRTSEPTETCSVAGEAYANSVAGGLTGLSSATFEQLADPNFVLGQVKAAETAAGATDPLSAPACRGASWTSYYQALAEYTSAAGVSDAEAEEEAATNNAETEAGQTPAQGPTAPTSAAPTAGGDTTSTVVAEEAANRKRTYSALSSFFASKAGQTQSAAMTDAVYGTDTVIQRLSSDLTKSIKNASGSDYSALSVTLPDYTSRVVDYAVFYGGVIPPWDTAGKRVGSLAAVTTGSDITGGFAIGGATANGQVDIVIQAAMKYLGMDYAWGGGGPKGPSYGIDYGSRTFGFDCSGLTEYAYAQVGAKIGGTTRVQQFAGKAVPNIGAALPGDLILFGPGGVHHVAIYLGNDQMIHAPKTGDVIKISKVSGYGIKQINTIRRILEPQATSTVAMPGASGASLAALGTAPDWATRLPAAGQQFRGLIEASAVRYQVRPEVIASFMWSESHFKVNVCSGVGACGLMQIMPGTANSLGLKTSNPDERGIPEKIIPAGTDYIAQQLRTGGGNLTLAAAAYNAGPGAVRKYGGVPPFTETQKYVKLIDQRFKFMAGLAPSAPA